MSSDEKCFTQMMYVVSITSFPLGVIAAIINLLFYGFSTNCLLIEMFFLMFNGASARYLYRRSKNLEAVLFDVRISPSGPEEVSFFVDRVSFGIAIFCLLAAMFAPTVMK
jgi:hypothetical protein